MRASALLGWLTIAGIAAARPGLRRRQAQTPSDSCTCPANGPTTTTEVQTSVVTSFTTVTVESDTVYNTEPTSTQVITVSSTSTTTVTTGTTTITVAGGGATATAPATTVTSTITADSTQTTCLASGGVPKLKRQNTVSASTLSDDSGQSSGLVVTSTVYGKPYQCLCRPRSTTSTLAGAGAGTVSCQCPATTAATITVSSTSTSTTMITVTTTIPAREFVTPTAYSTTTEQVVETYSDVATTQATDDSITVTTQSTETVYTTFTSTVNSCPTNPASTTTTSSTSTTVSLATTPTASGGFVCNSTAYLVETSNNVITFYNIDLASGKTFVFATNVGKGTYTTINGIGYNPIDNFVYGIAAISGNNYAIVRILTSGTVQQITAFTASSFPGSVGEIDPNGQFYFSGGGTNWYQADMAPGSSTFGTIVNNGTSTLTGFSVFDWAYIVGQGNYLYSVARSTGSSPHVAILRWSLDTHIWSTYAEYSNILAPYSYIGSWGSSNGTIWAIAATTGQITRDILGTAPVNLGIGPTNVTSADGARCYLAPA